MIERSDSNADFGVDTALDTNALPIAEVLMAQSDTGTATATDATPPEAPAAPEQVSLVVEVENGAVLRLPEGTSIDAPRMNGANLEFVQPDGSVVVVPNGAIEGLTIVLGGVEIPPLAVAALFAASDIQTAAGPASAGVQSSGGNFEVLPAGDIGTAFAYGDLLDGTDLPTTETTDEESFDNNLAPRFIFSVTQARLSEEGLAGGNADTDGNADTTNDYVYSGNLNATDPNGDPLAFRFGQPTSPVTSHGVALTWTGIGTPTLSGWAGDTLVIQAVIAEGSGAFTITLSGPVDHPAGGGENELRFDLPVTASDGRGGSASTAISIIVEDDSPTVVVSAKTGEGAPALLISLDEAAGPDLRAGSGDAAITRNGNIDDAEGALAQLKTSFEGGLAALFNVSGGYGADGAGSSSAVFSFAGIPAGGLATHLSATNGGLITLFLEDGVIVGRDTALDAVFKIEIVGAPGAEQLHTTLFEAISHTGEGSQFDERALLQLLGEGAVQLKFDVTRTDFDGDTTTNTATINLVTKDSTVVSFEDDSPKMNEEFRLRMTVDEDDIATSRSLGTSPNDGNGDGSYTESPNNNARGPATVSGSLAGAVDFGSDGAATGGGFSISANAVNYFNSLGLTSKGDELSFSTTDGKLTATAGDGRIVFEFSVQSNGSYDFRLYDQLDHDKPASGADQNFDLQDTVAGDVTWLDFGGAVSATDGDGDWVDLGGKLEIRIRDDVPELVRGHHESVTVDEDDINTRWSEGTSPSGSSEGSNDNSRTGLNGAATVGGSLAHLVRSGADENLTFGFRGASYVTHALESLGLSSAGNALEYEVRDGVLYAYVDPRGSHNDHVVFKLTLGSNGDYKFELFDQLDHDAGQGQNYDLQDGLWRVDVDAINFGKLVLATDHDGDSVSLDGAFEIRVRDDVPELVRGAGVSGTVEEEALPGGNEDRSATPDIDEDTQHNSRATDFVVRGSGSNSLATLLEPGADEDGKFAFKSGLHDNRILTSAGTSVRSDGDLVTIEKVTNGQDSGGRFQLLTAEASDGRDIFTLKVYEDGDWEFKLLQQLDHTYGDNKEGFLTLNLSGLLKFTDADGDTINLDNAKFTVRVIDDIPEITLVATAHVNLLTNGDFADGSWTGASWGGGLATEAVGWKITGTEPGQGNVQLEYVQDGYFGMHAPSGGRMVDLGSSPGNTVISQSLTGLTVGQSYTLTFAMGSPDAASSRLEVYWNGQLIQSSVPTGSMVSVTLDGLLPDANGNGVLSFKEVGTLDYTGTYLADVGFAPTGAVDLPLLGGSIDENGTATINLGDHFSFGADGAGRVSVNPATVVITTPTGTVLGQPTITVDPVTGQLHVNPGWGFDGLSQGEIATITIPYTVTDQDGDSKTGLYQLTINGQNDQVRTSEGFPDTGTITEYAEGQPHAGSADIRTEFDAPAGHAGYNGGGFWIHDDQGDTHSVTVMPGANAGYFGTLVASVSEETAVDGNGFVRWLYSVSDAALNPLQAGEQKIETFTVRVSDGHGTFADRLITVTLVGTNDKPVISVEAGDLDHVVLNETNAGLEAHGTLSVIDIDVKDVVTASVSGVTATGLGANVTDAQLKAFFNIAAGPVIDGTHTSGDIAWTFNSGSEAFNFLAAGAEAMIKYTIQVSDGHGGNMSHDVEIKLVGTNDLPVVDLNGVGAGNDAGATAVEQLPQCILTAATLADIDSPRLSSMTVRFVGRPDGISEALWLNPAAHAAAIGLSVRYDATLGVLTITGAASVNAYQTILQGVTYLNGSDNPATTGHSVEVIVNDGLASSVAHSVEIKVTPVNDAPGAPFDNNGARNEVAENAAAGTVVGLTAKSIDVDGDTITYSLTNDANGRFAIDRNTGVVTVKTGGVLDYETATQHTITVQASDGHGGVNSTNFAITVKDVQEGPVGIATSTAFYAFSNNAAPAGKPTSITLDLTTLFIGTAAGTTYSFQTVRAGDGNSEDTSVSSNLNGQKWNWLTKAGNVISGNPAPSDTGVYILKVIATAPNGGTAFTYVALTVLEKDATSESQGNVVKHWVGNEVILPAGHGFGGDISAGTGTDILIGNSGDNRLFGDSNSDALYGGAGADYLDGGSQSDFIAGGAGNDTIYGRDGNDTILGEDGNDAIDSGSGNDVVIGGAGDDIIYAAEGNDIVYGNDGNDRLYVGSGDDKVYGGAGDDLLTDGDGNDTYFFGLKDGQDIIDEGSGTDRIVITAAGAELTSFNGYDNGVGKNLGDLVVEFNGQSITVLNHFVGTNDRVELINFDGASYQGYHLGSTDYAVGRDSDSTNIRVPLSTNGNDFLVGELNATNTFSGDGGNDLLFGGDRADNLSGGQGNDLLIGGGGNDILTGNEGDDILWGGLGNDTLTGGTGNDTFVFGEAGTANADIIKDYVLGDVIDLSDLLGGFVDNQKASHVHVDATQNTISVDRGSGWELVATIEPSSVGHVEIKIGDDLAHLNLNI